MHRKAQATDLSKALLQLVRDKYGPEVKAVFLTGSHARQEAKAWSEISLLVITEHASEEAFLFPQGRPVSLQVRPLEGFLTDLYAPEGQQVIDWWLLAGRLQEAVPWLDSDGLLLAAKRVIALRRPVIELYSRILWDDQIAVLEHWRNELANATPFAADYLLAVGHILQRAETALLIFHGEAVTSRDIGQLSRPKSFLADWTTVLCLGAEPRDLDQSLCFDALAQTVRAICLAGQLQAPTVDAAWADRLQLLDKLAAADSAPLALPEALLIPRQLVDQALAILWAAAASLERREPAKLAATTARLWSLLAETGLLQTEPLLLTMRHARIPQAANSARVLAAAERLQQGLQRLGQTPTILPQAGRKQA